MKTPIEKDELITLVPHKGKMFLIERLTDYDTDAWTIASETTVRETCLFYDAAIDGIPNYVIFELIAQTISALTGIVIKEKKLPVNMGFILSVSAFKFDVPVVTCGQTISVKAERTGEVDNVYSFCAEVCVDGRAIGGGKLTVLEVRS
ncbi:MAG: 3-hydroxylacyl-ACP dehydratase [Treponema sp.]|nr:3-hydroxylacyl-ACP dehydratase [Treponema sp.]